MRILVVDDDTRLCSIVRRGLLEEAYAVDVAYDGDQGLIEVTHEDYDLIILDRMLPGEIDGVGILKDMRKQGNMTPVIFLTAKDSLNDRVEGLNVGADDYLVKPFAPAELVAGVDRRVSLGPLVGERGGEVEVLYQVANRLVNVLPGFPVGE